MGHTATILVVENDAIPREIAALILEAEGYRVAQAAGGHQAMQMMKSGNSFDLIFSDITMPGGMDGIQLAHQIAHMNESIPVVLTSGHSPSNFENFPTHAAFLPKPYNRQALLGILREHLSG